MRSFSPADARLGPETGLVPSVMRLAQAWRAVRMSVGVAAALPGMMQAMFSSAMARSSGAAAARW